MKLWNEFMSLNRKEQIKHIVVWICVLLFFVFLYFFNQGVDKVSLMDTEGAQFERATVVEIISESRNESGQQLGTQVVNVELKSGDYAGEIVEATNIDSYLYGADCQVGTDVIVQVSEYDGSFSASVYNYDRTNTLFMIVAFFLICLVMIGKRKGLTSAISLIFTFICIIYLYLPMLYLGFSPFLGAVIVTIITTLMTMYLIGGFSMKTYCSIIGTVCGVVVAGLFAALCGMFTNINGYNVEDIESLIYIGQSVPLDVSGLLFSAILIASLGAVVDMSMSIATTLEELVYHNPNISRAILFKSGIKIGGDMMGTMSNTLILAFVGSSLSTLMIYYAYNIPFLQMINSYDIGIEIIQGISGSLGVIMTVPFVSFVSSVFMTKKAKKDVIKTR